LEWHKIGRSIENLKMKKLIKGCLMVTALLFLMNCSSQIINATNIKREWMLVEFQDFSKDLMIKNKAKLDLSKTTNSDKRFTANMGCNGMFGQATFKANGAVAFSQMGSTKMFCNENMNLETEFGKILPAITMYKVEGHRLTLSNKSGALLKFVALDWD
jgi:heat shock protein HslJ